ncbi:MAG: DUF2189 domain-containing protein [Hyphomicrobiaceae bacterium]
MTTRSLSGKADPIVRKIGKTDVLEALSLGLRDFQRAPVYGLTLGAVCALTGLAILLLLMWWGMPYFAYPLGAGFAIVAPFIGTLLYEVSRRLEQALPLSWTGIWQTVKSRSEVRWMGFMTLFVLIVWMYQVRLLLAVILGFTAMSASMTDFMRIVLTTSEGLTFLAIGNVVGAILGTILFSLSVVSFPLVLDRDVDFVTAMITSVRAVSANAWPMALWAAIIVGVLLVSSLPFFLGLVVTLPVLGHASWHLYRRVVAAEEPTAGRAA